MSATDRARAEGGIDPRTMLITDLANELAQERGLDMLTLLPEQQRIVLDAARRTLDERQRRAAQARSLELARQTEAGIRHCQRLMHEIRLTAGIDQQQAMANDTDEDRAAFVEQARRQFAI